MNNFFLLDRCSSRQLECCPRIGIDNVDLKPKGPRVVKEDGRKIATRVTPRDMEIIVVTSAVSWQLLGFKSILTSV